MSQIRGKQIKSTAVGQLLHGDGAGFALLPVGTAGQVLTVSGGDVVWASPSVPSAFRYKGVVNAANAIAGQVGTPITGDYWMVDTTGNTENFAGTWDAVASAPFVGAVFLPGDSIVFNGTKWDKFDNNAIGVLGTTNRVAVSHDSLAETYTVDISSSYAGQTSITTLGTIGTGTWQSTAIARQFGGTGSDTSAIGANRILFATGTTTTSGIVAPTTAGTVLNWTGSAFTWITPVTNAYGVVDGDTGVSTAVGTDTLTIAGGLGLITASASGTVTIDTDIASGSVLVNNVGTGTAQLGIRGATSGTLLQAKGSGTEAAFTTSTFPSVASVTAGSFLRSDGTNFVNSTLILPNAATANSALVANTTNTVTAVTASTSGQVLRYNGTAVGFGSVSYSDLVNTPVWNAVETVVVTGGANLTLTGFFSTAPVVLIKVQFNGLVLRQTGYTVSGQDLTLVDSVNGYAAETGDVIEASYFYL